MEHIERLVAVRRHSAKELTKRKLRELAELARRWQSARRRYIRDYWDETYVDVVFRSPRALVEVRRNAGWARIPLLAHYHKTAMDSALDHVRAEWARTFARVRRDVRIVAFSDHERHWLWYVLRCPPYLQSCLAGSIVHIDLAWAKEVDERRLSIVLAALIRAHRGRRPRKHRALWFNIDCNQYRPFARPEDRYFRSAWIAITGLEANHRVNVPLAGRTLDDLNQRHNLRVELVRDRVVFHAVRRLDVLERTADRDAGLDKGYRSLVTISFGDVETAASYGRELGTLIDSARASKHRREVNRARLAVHASRLSVLDASKAKRIRRTNLSSHKSRRLASRGRRAVLEYVNQTLNLLFREHADVSRLFVESLHFSTRRRFDRVNNERLTFWPKGLLQRRLSDKAKANGVRLESVNAAWTSLTCPRCGFPSKQSRTGERFTCIRADCGFTGSADAVAATNVLLRGRERGIPTHASSQAVYSYLLERWRSAQSGCARDSNAEASGRSGDPGAASGGVANNLGASRRSTIHMPT